jgi:hypothetical protein
MRGNFVKLSAWQRQEFLAYSAMNRVLQCFIGKEPFTYAITPRDVLKRRVAKIAAGNIYRTKVRKHQGKRKALLDEKESASEIEEAPARNSFFSSASPRFVSYGGEYSIVGRTYQLKVAVGFSFLQLVNRISKSFYNISEVVFAADGTLRRPGEETSLAMGNVDPRWRFDPHYGRFMIDFFQDGVLLPDRWDELRPTTDPCQSSSVPELVGIGHVGNRTYEYSLVDSEMSHLPSATSADSLEISTNFAALNAAAFALEAVAELHDEAEAILSL